MVLSENKRSFAPAAKKREPRSRQNCWEFYNCPQERQNVCSAFKKGAGRRCWQVAGTLCEGKTDGMFARKIGDCMKCEFYIQVHARRW